MIVNDFISTKNNVLESNIFPQFDFAFILIFIQFIGTRL